MPIMNTHNGNCRCQQNNKVSLLNSKRLTMVTALNIFSLSFCGFLFSVADAGRGEIFETNRTAGLGQKNYEEQEEDTLVPHR